MQARDDNSFQISMVMDDDDDDDDRAFIYRLASGDLKQLF
jgi:hypothetical protein